MGIWQVKNDHNAEIIFRYNFLVYKNGAYHFNWNGSSTKSHSEWYAAVSTKLLRD